MPSNGAIEEANVPLLEDLASSPAVPLKQERVEDDRQEDKVLAKRVWIESKKLWHIVGPAIFSRLSSYSMFVITQAFAGHMGDLELAAMSIASNVIMSFDFGLLVLNFTTACSYNLS